MPAEPTEQPSGVAVDVASLSAPFAAINVGLDSFYDSLVEQGAEALQLDWRMSLLERMK